MNVQFVKNEITRILDIESGNYIDDIVFDNENRLRIKFDVDEIVIMVLNECIPHYYFDYPDEIAMAEAILRNIFILVTADVSITYRSYNNDMVSYCISARKEGRRKIVLRVSYFSKCIQYIFKKKESKVHLIEFSIHNNLKKRLSNYFQPGPVSRNAIN